jgi:hypothetical protein
MQHSSYSLPISQRALSSADETVVLAAELGGQMLAPLLRSFALWLHEKATRDGVRQLFFLARDGYMMQRVYREVIPAEQQIANHYMYASRRLFNFAAIRRLDDRALYFLCGDRDEMPLSEYLRRIGLDTLDCDEQIRQVGFEAGAKSVVRRRDHTKLRQLFCLLEPNILAQAEAERNLLRRYAESLADWDSQRCAVVDAGWHGTLQHSLSDVLELPAGALRGYYFGLHRFSRRINDKATSAYLEESRVRDFVPYRNTVRRCVEVFELLFAETQSSIVGLEELPDGTVGAVRGGIVMPKQSQLKLAQIQDSAIKALRTGASPTMSRNEVVAALSRLMTNPSLGEVTLLGDIEHQSGFGERGKIAPLARPRYGVFGYLMRPFQLVADWRQAFWRRGFWVRLTRG